MNDTSPQMQQKQFEIYQSKSLEEKFRMITEMMEYGVNQTVAIIKKWHPNKTENELQLEFFKLYYRDDFDDDNMAKWISKMKENDVFA